jgi:hypothetical protein
MSDETARLADAVLALAAQADQPELRGQLHALRGAILNLGREADAAQREPLERALATALEREDEPAVIAAMRSLAAFERAAVVPLDWTAASHG